MMADPVRKVCVIGAGTMGSGIAAQVANAGAPVLLLRRSRRHRQGRGSEDAQGRAGSVHVSVGR